MGWRGNLCSLCSKHDLWTTGSPVPDVLFAQLKGIDSRPSWSLGWRAYTWWLLSENLFNPGPKDLSPTPTKAKPQLCSHLCWSTSESESLPKSYIVQIETLFTHGRPELAGRPKSKLVNLWKAQLAPKAAPRNGQDLSSGKNGSLGANIWVLLGLPSSLMDSCNWKGQEWQGSPQVWFILRLTSV